MTAINFFTGNLPKEFFAVSSDGNKIKLEWSLIDISEDKRISSLRQKSKMQEG